MKTLRLLFVLMLGGCHAACVDRCVNTCTARGVVSEKSQIACFEACSGGTWEAPVFCGPELPKPTSYPRGSLLYYDDKGTTITPGSEIVPVPKGGESIIKLDAPNGKIYETPPL